VRDGRDVFGTVWDWEPGELRRHLGRDVLTFRHRLSERAEFTSDAVVDVVERVPDAWSRPHSCDVPVVFPEKARVLEGSPSDVAREMAHAGNRLAVYNLEKIAPYRSFVDHTSGQLAAAAECEGGLRRISLGFILTSPKGVVPAHFDRHHNLLLQLEGDKKITVGTYDDPVASQQVVERARREAHDNLSELPPRTRTFVLGPGDGIYIPPYAFHWAHGGSEVSVALSYGFSTPRTDRAAAVHWCNANLRRLGLRPRPPGGSEQRDRAKAYAITHAVRARDALVDFSRRGRRGPAEPASAR
jgi:hypothetical protein